MRPALAELEGHLILQHARREAKRLVEEAREEASNIRKRARKCIEEAVLKERLRLLKEQHAEAQKQLEEDIAFKERLDEFEATRQIRLGEIAEQKKQRLSSPDSTL